MQWVASGDEVGRTGDMDGELFCASSDGQRAHGSAAGPACHCDGRQGPRAGPGGFRASYLAPKRHWRAYADRAGVAATVSALQINATLERLEHAWALDK
jgi:hypothetical protein